MTITEAKKAIELLFLCKLKPRTSGWDDNRIPIKDYLDYNRSIKEEFEDGLVHVTDFTPEVFLVDRDKSYDINLKVGHVHFYDTGNPLEVAAIAVVNRKVITFAYSKPPVEV